MKSSTKLLIGVIVVIGILLGFFIGISVDFPKSKNKELAGTIGQVNNYRNVKVSESDIQLRSDLLSNESFLKSYRQYYSFSYAECVKLCEDITFAVNASEKAPQFQKDFPQVIQDVKQYQETLEQFRKDILLAVSSLQKLSEIDANDATQILNNANIAVAQIKYRENCVYTYVEAIEKFVKGHNPYEYSDLIKAHDLFSVTQLIIAAATNDKPMLKAYNNKQLMASHDGINVAANNNQLKSALQSDLNFLQNEFKNSEVLKVTNAAQLGVLESQIGLIIPSIEKLGIIICSSSLGIGGYICSSSENMGNTFLSSEKLGIDNAEKLGMGNVQTMGLILNTDKLGTFMNSEKLGIFNADKLGVCNFEKLGVISSQQLNAL